MKPFCSLILSLLALGAAAQQPAERESQISEPTLESLSAHIETLKAQAWDRFVDRLPKISGYVQLGYEGSETSSTFFIKRVRLNLTGDIAPKIDYRVQIEFASPKIVDAYLRYRPFSELNIQLGQYKIPFSIENTDYPPLRLELIEYPMALRRLMGFDDICCGISATGRDMGAMLSGGFLHRKGYSILSYNLAVLNGQGINVKDSNKSKDIAARITVRPSKGLLFSGSYYKGEYGAEYYKRDRYGAGACYDDGPIVVRSEYIWGTTGVPASGGGSVSDLDSDGWYVVAGWRATQTLMPVVRYDTFREDTSLADSRQTNYTAGLLWQPVKYLRCQVNYTYEDYAAAAASNRNVVSIMLTGIF